MGFARRHREARRVLRAQPPQTATSYTACNYETASARPIFLNQDPIGFAGGMNWFAFVGNNPISNVDPSGLIDSWGGLNMLSQMHGWRDEFWAGYHEINNGLPIGTIPRNGPLPGQEEFTKTWVIGTAAIGIAGVSALAAPEIIAATPVIYASGASLASAANTASLTAQAAVYNQAPAWLGAMGSAAVGYGIGRAPDGPAIMDMGNKWATAGYLVGTTVSNWDGVEQMGSGISKTASNTWNFIDTININGIINYSVPNNVFSVPPSMTGSVFLSVPSPSVASPKPPKPPGRG